LENVKSQLHAFSLFQENIIINKISGNKYLQYNDTYLTTVWSPLEKLNLEKQFDIVEAVDLQVKLQFN
jgi:ribosomal protein S9